MNRILSSIAVSIVDRGHVVLLRLVSCVHDATKNAVFYDMLRKQIAVRKSYGAATTRL